MDKFEAIRNFCEIVKAGSFAKAANVLDVSTTSSSRRLQELEDQIGVRLLHRSTRSLSLTEAGEILFRHYGQMLEDLAAIEGKVAKSSLEATGLLRVALPNTFATLFMKTMLRDYQSNNPSVELDVLLSDNRVDLVAERVDVALRIARELDPAIVARRLTTIRVIICASPAYLEKHGEPQVPADLLKHACLLYTGNNPADEWHFDGPAGHIVQRVRGANRANNGEILREAALAGEGIIAQPTFVIGEDLEAGKLVRILGDYELAPLTAYAIYSDRDHLPRKVRTFVDFLVERFSPPVWMDGLSKSK